MTDAAPLMLKVGATLLTVTATGVLAPWPSLKVMVKVSVFAAEAAFEAAALCRAATLGV